MTKKKVKQQIKQQKKSDEIRDYLIELMLLIRFPSESEF